MLRCHYDVLGVPRDADESSIKKAHRKLALQFHPDKNRGAGEDDSSEQFRLVQQAYETLSDPSERVYYDEHREALLTGWSASPSSNRTTPSCDATQRSWSCAFFVDLVRYRHPSCYTDFSDLNTTRKCGFYGVYRQLFQTINDQECNASPLPGFGVSTTGWEAVSAFYSNWLNFSSGLSFSWADEYDTRQEGYGIESKHRIVQRAMVDANIKARKLARKARNDDVRGLVKFVHRRDPRVASRKLAQELLRQERLRAHEDSIQSKKKQTQQARQEWRRNAQVEQQEQEEVDRLAGRIRLADLDDEDYDYGGKKKKKNKKKGKVNMQSYSDVSIDDKKERMEDDDGSDNDANSTTTTTPTESSVSLETGMATLVHEKRDNAYREHDATKHENQLSFTSSIEKDEDDGQETENVWRCEVCRKDFKSTAQLENHLNSKKHKQMYRACLLQMKSATGS